MMVTSKLLFFRRRCCSAFLRSVYYSEIEMFMKIWNFIYNNKYTLCLILSVFLYTSDAFAVFESLNNAGNKIFTGLKSLVAPAATIGIACVCIAGMFGNFNWKWFAAIAIGVFVMTVAVAISTSISGGEFDGRADLLGNS